MKTLLLLLILLIPASPTPAAAQNRDDSPVRKTDPKRRTVTYRQGKKVKTLQVKELFPPPSGLRRAPGPEHKLNDKKLESGVKQRERMRRRTGGRLK